MLEISFRNGKDTFDGCSSNHLPLFVEKRVIFKMFNTLYVPPPLNNTSCIYHDSRPVYNKPSNMRNISKYFQCLSIYKIDKFTNIHIHNTIGHSLLYQFHPMASFGGLFASSVPPAFLRYVFFLYHVLK